MPEYVIGVDIGGTKSHLALFDAEGNIIELGQWGGLNHEGMSGSFVQFENELGQFVNQVFSKNSVSINQVSGAAFGIAGVDTKEQHSIVSQILKKIGFKNFTLTNDAYLGIPAGSRNGVGICAINGTGCTIAGLNKKGDFLQIGGLGYITGDKGGGGAYMGTRMLSEVYNELFRKGTPTILTSYMFENLGITNKYDYVEKICKKINAGNFPLYKCSPIIFEAVKQNDSVAASILREIAESYANGISCMIEELKFPDDDDLYVVLAGSVFVKGDHPLLVDTLKGKVSNDNPGRRIKYNLLNVPNVAGAVIWAFNLLDGKNDYYDKVCSQFTGN